MKNIKIIKFISPVVIASSIVATLPLFVSCGSVDKEKDKPETVKLNMGETTHINVDPTVEKVDTPAYIYNESLYATAKIVITLPWNSQTSTPLINFRIQKGKRVRDEIRWLDPEVLTQQSTTIDCTYAQPVRFFAVNEGGLTPTYENATNVKIIGDGDSGEFEDPEYGVHLAGSLISMLGYSYNEETKTLEAYNQLSPGKDYTFCYLFKDSKALFGAGPNLLPFKVLNEYCYTYMFEGCENLRSMPILPATQKWVSDGEDWKITEGLPIGCYGGMFENCHSLKTAPHLPARILSEFSYYRMFSKTGVKTLSMSYVGNFNGVDTYNFQDIINNGSGQHEPIVLRYNGLDNINNTFIDPALTDPVEVTKITATDEWISNNLKTIEIKDDSQFDKMTSTVSTDTPLKFRVYKDFNFETVKQQFPEISPIDQSTPYSLSWFNGETKKKIENIETLTADELPSVLIPRYVSDIQENDKYTNVICESAAILKSTNVGTNQIYYRFNDTDNWNVLTRNKVVDIPANSNLRLYGKLNNSSTSGVNIVIQLKDTTTGTPVRLSGNVMSLIRGNSNGVDPTSEDAKLKSNETYAFANLFKGSTGIGEISDNFLPSNTITKYAYYHMFDGCTKLKNMPILPAATIAESCYEGMFNGCSKLESAYTQEETPISKIKATSVEKACFKNMFTGCTSLQKAPILPTITTAPESCYEAMFSGCTNLTVDEKFKFSATIASPKCYYQMFYGCKNLVSFPGETDIKLTQLLTGNTKATNACREMFKGCESLITPLDLPATKIYGACYYSIYEGCVNMKRPAILGNGAVISDDQTGAADCMFNGCTSMEIYDQTTKPSTGKFVLCFSTWTDSSSYNLPKEVYTGAKGQWTTVSNQGQRLKSGYVYYYKVQE